MIATAMTRVLPFLCCLGILAALRWWDLGVAGSGPQSTTVAIGFLLIGAFIGGQVAALVKLPRITGYLVVGLLVGPHVSALLTTDMMYAAKTVEGIAVSLIALTAGGEIRVEWVKKLAKRLTLMTMGQLALVAIGVFCVVFFFRPLFPFVPDDDVLKAAVIAMVFGSIAVASSPTVTIAVIAENAAEGPVSRTVLGVTVLKDVCIIVLFAISLAIAKDALGHEGGGSLALTLARELGGSIGVGLFFGGGISIFLRHVGKDTPVFILGVCFGISQVAETFHLEALLIALTAGFWVENFSRAEGEDLISGIERLSLPIYALFFAAAGAKVNVGALAAMWPLALLLAGVRAGCIWAGTRLGAKLSRAEPAVTRYAWYGFISQAGVTLALSSIVARAFPGWGAEVQVIIIAMIAIHEFAGPIGFQFALKWAGEVGKGKPGAGHGHGH